MNRFLLLLFTLFLVHATAIAQRDMALALPITVSLSVDKERHQKVEKGHYSDEMARGELYIGTDSIEEEQFDVTVAIKNMSTRPVSIWLMTCSWQDNFQINNNYIHYDGIICYSNYPKLVRFNSGETKTYKTTLGKSVKFEHPGDWVYGPQVETTKLGLILVDDVYEPKLSPVFGYFLAMDDKSSWKIVWSNPLFLLSKAEAKTDEW